MPRSWAGLTIGLSADADGLVAVADMDPVPDERKENDAGVFDNQFNQKERSVRTRTPACAAGLAACVWCADIHLRRRTWCTTS